MSENFSKSLQIEEAKVESFYLLNEILIDIVLRLPIKSIITWTYVSKSWNSLIKNPKFISTHLNHNNHNQKPQLLFLRKLGKSLWDHTAKTTEKEVYSLNWDHEPFDEYTRFDFPFHALRTDRAFHVVGTCNGLVCLANAHNFFVWNPCIRKYVTVPTFFSDHRRYAGCGFGFDSKTNDYKVVRIVDELKQRDIKVKVYSLATREWKMVNDVPRTCILSEREQTRQAFVNGALHWVASYKANYEYPTFILAFDLGDENFREIMLPNELHIHSCFDAASSRCVSVFGESLAVYRRLLSDTCTEIWVMKEYGVLESWTKVLIVDSQGGGYIRRAPEAVGLRNNGEVILEVEQGKLVSLDPEHKMIKDLTLRVPYGYTFVDPYVESLVLVDNLEGVVSY